MPRGGQSIKYQYVNAKNAPLQIGYLKVLHFHHQSFSRKSTEVFAANCR